jgi:hypothetical protein
VWSRRSYLVATIGIPALSGCGSAPENGGPTDTEPGEPTDESDEELPEGVSRDVFENGPVPDVYLSATSLGEETRGSETLVDKEAAGFAEYDVAVEQESHQPGTCCANCADYIIDRNGDTFGACVAVEGYIDGADWCTLWEELPEPALPDGMSAEDVATATVPEEYRTASSQVGEERNPDDLFTHEEVSLTESVDALAEGTAAPGQSCGNCAEFIPDENGDGWGACAKVEGYIAVEDWCSVWEHVSDEIEG